MSFDGVSLVGPTDGTTTQPVAASRALIANDNHASFAVREFLDVTVDTDGLFHYQSLADGALLVSFNPLTGEEDDSHNPLAWNIYNRNGPFTPDNSPAAGPTTAAGSGSFMAVGTLAIEKDFPNDVIRWISPMGTLSARMSDLAARYPGSIAMDDTPLLPSGIAHGFRAGNSTMDQSETTDWLDLVVSRDGTIVYQVLMTAGNPLIFNVITSDEFATVNHDVQLAARFQTQTATAPPFPLPTPPSSGGDTSDVILAGQELFIGPVDCCPVWPHRWVICAWVNYNGALYYRRSLDNARSWDYQFITRPPQCLSPTIQWLEGLIAVLYYDGSQIQKTVSHDHGVTWSSPMPAPVTGSNPRLIIAPDSTWFYFFWAGGNIKLQRSFDGGTTLFDAAPIIVAPGVPQQDFAAVIGSDLTLIVTFQGADNFLHSRKTPDFGQTWQDA